MFLKKLLIENNTTTIREILFEKGINLIVDETKTEDRKESGNNVGKTTVLRLIDFCLGGDGKNIYEDTEYKKQGNTNVKSFLQENNIVITLLLKEDLEEASSDEVLIRRNFLTYGDKIQEINGVSYGNPDFRKELKKLIFHSTSPKPTIRQIIAKNIRDEKNRLQNTTRVLHPTTSNDEYEALYLFWLGIDLDNSERKQRLLGQRKVEEGLQKRLHTESNLSQIEQSLIVLNRMIDELTRKKDSFNLNKDFEKELESLNKIKGEVNSRSTLLSRLELRRELIIESKNDLESEVSNINTQQIKNLYNEAKSLIPELQKSFEETLTFHNQMVGEKVKFITQELPELEAELSATKRKLNELLATEKSLTEKLQKSGAIDELQKIISELNKSFEKKGALEEQKKLWETTHNKLKNINDEIKDIDDGINSKDELIQKRIATFNSYFSDISNRLYGEQFILSSDKNEKGYELNISSIGGNLGTGKKKGQMASFDLAYIQFADSIDFPCLHFILQDQIENVHDNQINSLLTEIVSGINCQYILPVLRDKLPKDIDVRQYEVLSLSQTDKLFRFE
ncbi:MAG: DUF2326 domain-containing protein [Nitrospinae bacterium]|nr:DUF2326 domain-containing protein [Nitrospinota bacterium]